MSSLDPDLESVVKAIASRRLTEIRHRAGLGQTRFAESFDLTRSTYRNYEHGSRQLPQSARLAVLRHCGEDPLSTDDLIAALADGKRPAPDEETSSFWAALRAECRTFRRRTYSAPAQRLLVLRDHAYVAATTYWGMAILADRMGLRSTFEVDGLDWVLIASVVTVLALFVPVTSEVPGTRIVQHLRSRRSA